MRQSLILAHLIVLLIIIINEFVHYYALLHLLPVIQIYLKVFWVITGIVLLFYEQNNYFKTYLLIFPITLSISILAIVFKGFLAALFLVILINFFVPNIPLDHDGDVSISEGNNFISPTHNYELYARLGIVEKKIATLELDNQLAISKIDSMQIGNNKYLKLVIFDRYESNKNERDTFIYWKNLSLK